MTFASLFEPLQSLPEAFSPCVRICPTRWQSSCLLQVVKMRTSFYRRSIAVSSSKSSPNVIVTNHHVEVCLFSQRNNISTLIHPITGKPSLFPQSHTLTPFDLPYSRFSLCEKRGIRTFHVPYKQLTSGLEPALLPAALCLCNPSINRINRLLTILVKAYQLL